MATSRQLLGSRGETLVAKFCSCPKCKRSKTLKRLPVNFKCADVICDFCGFLGQVKASTSADIEKLPSRLLGAAWGPQSERMQSGIYFPLFLVLVCGSKVAIYYLPSDLQTPALFKPRMPLSGSARRAGWTGFVYELSTVAKGGVVRLK